jgi:hypothetical protein
MANYNSKPSCYDLEISTSKRPGLPLHLLYPKLRLLSQKPRLVL